MKESWYDRNILPWLLDMACGISPVRRQRAKVVPHATGHELDEAHAFDGEFAVVTDEAAGGVVVRDAICFQPA